jgi:type II secretory pathway pseudopilin PulG
MRQRGYNLVILIMAITVLNILVAISLPMWSSIIQRDKEEELMSRGWQYVEAIRVFQNRFQRLPVRLEELMEVKPRCLRRLWKDPMTDGGKFVPLHPDQPQPGGLQVQQPAPEEGGGEKPMDPGEGEGQAGPDPGAFNPGGTPKEELTVGPIVGVRSRSTKKSSLVFDGKEHYNEWRFTLDMMLQGRPPAGGAGQQTNQPPVLAPGAGMNLSVRWLGRPLPSFLQAPGGGMPMDGEPPSDPGSGLNPGGGKLPTGGSPPGGKLPTDGRGPRGKG